jgi:hypothetical protein
MMKHMAYNLMSMLHRDVWFTQQDYTIQMDMYETKFNSLWRQLHNLLLFFNRQLLHHQTHCFARET